MLEFVAYIAVAFAISKMAVSFKKKSTIEYDKSLHATEEMEQPHQVVLANILQKIGSLHVEDVDDDYLQI